MEPPRTHPVAPDLIPVPDPSELARAKAVLDSLPALIRFVRDVADWAETLDLDACDCATNYDIEELGRRAHELAVRLGGPGREREARRDAELDSALQELDRHAV